MPLRVDRLLGHFLDHGLGHVPTRAVARGAAVLAGLACTALATLTATPAQAQAWPARPLTLVVPWPAGGSSDFVARQVQADVAKALGQPLVIDNVGGVGGALGVQKMLAATDGHTALLGSPLELIIPPLTIASVKYKPQDLRLVAQLVKAPLVLVARKDLPASTVDELIALAQKQRATKPLAIANTGPGSMFHLVGEKFAQAAGVELLHVPYKGSAPAMADLMGGQVDLMFTIFAGPIPASIADGKLKAIGIAAAQPLARFPAIGTLAAHPKLKGFEFDSWAGIQVPRNTPDDVAQRLHKALYDAMQNPATRQAFEAAGNQVVAPVPLAELERLYQGEIARYQAIARSINLQAQ